MNTAFWKYRLSPLSIVSMTCLMPEYRLESTGTFASRLSERQSSGDRTTSGRRLREDHEAEGHPMPSVLRTMGISGWMLRGSRWTKLASRSPTANTTQIVTTEAPDQQPSEKRVAQTTKEAGLHANPFSARNLVLLGQVVPQCAHDDASIRQSLVSSSSS